MLRLALLLLAFLTSPANAELRPFATDTPDGRAIVERLRGGGLVLFFRHADTLGMPCDRTFRVGDREGQRNISLAGQRQSEAIGRAFADLGIPIAFPVLAGPVYRARDTAEFAFGRERVRVIEGLTADDFSGPRLDFVLGEHRRLFNAAPPMGANAVLVGHRTPAIMVLGPSVGGRAFPEGAAIVMEPGTSAPRVLGIWMPAPIVGAGFHGC